MPTYRSHFSFIPKFKQDNIDFGGFLIDKFINSQPGSIFGNGNPESLTSPITNKTIPSISQPSVPIWDNVSMVDAMIISANRGKGWHLITPIEAASISYLAKNFNIQPSGNTNGSSNPPSSYNNSDEIGIYDQEVSGRALAGSGNLNWSQNKIFDMKGLARERCMMLMGSTNYTAPGTLFVNVNNELSYLNSPHGRGVFRTNVTQTFERIYMSTSDLSNFALGHSIEDGTGEATGTIVRVDDTNDYIYAKVTANSFINKSSITDTTSGATGSIDGSAGTLATGIDSLISMHCNDSSNTIWDKQWTVNEFNDAHMFIAESTVSGELISICCNTTDEIIFDTTPELLSSFEDDDFITFCVLKAVDSDSVTSIVSSGTWTNVKSVYNDSTLGSSAIISEGTVDGTIFDGKQYFNYSSSPTGNETGLYLACQLFGSFNDTDNAGMFMKSFENTPDVGDIYTSFRACKSL